VIYGLCIVGYEGGGEAVRWRDVAHGGGAFPCRHAGNS